jgi:hypothetical protein
VAAGVVFLLASDVLGTWNGHAVSVRPSDVEDPDTFVVRIVEPEGRLIERSWPAELVLALDLPADAIAVPPAELPETAAPTTKGRFDLHMLVRGATDTEWQVVPTTSPRALVLGVVVGLIALFLRNMAVSGSPFAMEPRGVWLPPALARPGAPAPTASRSPSRPGPPPSGPRVGRGRR